LPVNANNIFFLILSLYFYYWIGNLLEREWGTPKFTLYYLSGMVLSVLTGLIVYFTGGTGIIYGAFYINLSMFFAFAVLYPDLQILLFFVIPVKVKWLAWLDAALFAVNILSAAFQLDLLGALLPVVAPMRIPSAPSSSSPPPSSRKKRPGSRAITTSALSAAGRTRSIPTSSSDTVPAARATTASARTTFLITSISPLDSG